MIRLEKRRRLWLALSIFSAVSAIAGTAALALTALRGMFLLAGMLTAVACHGFYGTVFYYRAYRHTVAMIGCLSSYESGRRTYADIAADASLTPIGAEYFINKIRKLGIAELGDIEQEGLSSC